MVYIDKFASMRAGSLYHRYFYSYLSFSGRRLTASMYTYSTIKQLNKILTVYD